MTTSSATEAPDNPLDLIYGKNPLLCPLGPRIAFPDLATSLANRPLRNIKLANLDAATREELLVLYQQNFAPTTTGINIIAALQNLHREHYWQRHPLNPTVLKDRTRIAQFIRAKDFDPSAVPWLSTSANGMIIKGITGTGKTSTINRYTDLICNQVYEHTDGAIPGFHYVKQIVWLKVDMSSDGSRKGFLTSILLEVDRLIGTDYAGQYSGRYSVDNLAIMVAVILSTHLCGMLIIEEIQEKNFNNSKWRNPLTTFFLRILNFGVPIVLIGNPLGFTELEKSSQNLRRLSSGGIFEMIPSLNGEDEDFETLVKHTISFNVMEQKSKEGSDYFRKVAYEYSGGIADFLVRLNVESQLLALREGKKEVSPKYIDAAFNSPRLAPNQILIRGLVSKNQNMICKCTDVPVERFIELWIAHNKNAEEYDENSEQQPRKTVEDEKKDSKSYAENEKQEIKKNTSPSNRRAHASATAHTLEKKFKSEQTRETTRRKKAIDQKEKLAPSDIRGEGANKSLAIPLKELLQNNNKT